MSKKLNYYTLLNFLPYVHPIHKVAGRKLIIKNLTSYIMKKFRDEI